MSTNYIKKIFKDMHRPALVRRSKPNKKNNSDKETVNQRALKEKLSKPEACNNEIDSQDSDLVSASDFTPNNPHKVEKGKYESRKNANSIDSDSGYSYEDTFDEESRVTRHPTNFNNKKQTDIRLSYLKFASRPRVLQKYQEAERASPIKNSNKNNKQQKEIKPHVTIISPRQQADPESETCKETVRESDTIVNESNTSLREKGEEKPTILKKETIPLGTTSCYSFEEIRERRLNEMASRKNKPRKLSQHENVKELRLPHLVEFSRYRDGPDNYSERDEDCIRLTKNERERNIDRQPKYSCEDDEEKHVTISPRKRQKMYEVNSNYSIEGLTEHPSAKACKRHNNYDMEMRAPAPAKIPHQTKRVTQDKRYWAQSTSEDETATENDTAPNDHRNDVVVLQNDPYESFSGHSVEDSIQKPSSTTLTMPTKVGLKDFFTSMCEMTSMLPEYYQIKIQRKIFEIIMAAREGRMNCS